MAQLAVAREPWRLSGYYFAPDFAPRATSHGGGGEGGVSLTRLAPDT